MKSPHTALINAGIKWVIAGGAVLALLGCSRFPAVLKPRPPAATISTPAAQVTQTGTAAVPASAGVTTEARAVPLPAGSEITFNEKLGTVTLKLSRDSALSTETRTEHVTGPQSFDPPAPPTPAEQAKGFGVRAFWVGALICLALAGLSAWAGHYLAAGCFGLAGVALPVLASFVASTAAMLAGVGLVAAGAGLFIAWHVIARRHGLEAGQPAAVVASNRPAGATAQP